MPLTQSDVLSALKKLFLAFMVYGFLILCLGYEFGNGDQTEIIPLLKEYLDAGYYSNDFFVQNYLAHGHGVRDGMIWLADLGHDYFKLNYWFFILHLFFGVIMILGGMTLLRHFTKNRAIIFASVCIIWGLMYGINLGSNEIYYPQLIPSLVAKSMLIWAIVFYVRNKFVIWPPLIVLASVWQDMASIQIYVLLTSATLIIFTRNLLSSPDKWRNTLQKTRVFPLILFILYSIVFIYLKKDLIFQEASQTSTVSITEVLLWRVGHHFDPALFGIRNYLLFLLMVSFGMPILYKKNFRLFIVCLLIIMGCIVYGLTYKFFPSIILTQWFKTTIWLKFICSGVLVIFISEFILKLISKKQKLNVQAALLTSCLILGIFKGPLKQVAYQLPFTTINYEDDIKIARLAKYKTTKESIFLIPPDNSTFKIWSGRGCYVDYKSTVFDAQVLTTWMERINLVYGVNMNDDGGFRAYPKMRAGYNKFVKDPANLRRIGVNHFISEEILSGYDLLGQQGRWKIYRLKKLI